MDKKLIIKFLLNALDDLSERYSYESCNDLYDDSSLLKGISPSEREKLQLAWIELFPKDAQEMENELNYDFQVIHTLEKLTKNLE